MAPPSRYRRHPRCPSSEADTTAPSPLPDDIPYRGEGVGVSPVEFRLLLPDAASRAKSWEPPPWTALEQEGNVASTWHVPRPYTPFILMFQRHYLTVRSTLTKNYMRRVWSTLLEELPKNVSHEDLERLEAPEFPEFNALRHWLWRMSQGFQRHDDKNRRKFEVFWEDFRSKNEDKKEEAVCGVYNEKVTEIGKCPTVCFAVD